MLGRLALDMARLVGQQRAGRVDALTARPPAPPVTGCWASQSISRSGCSLRSSPAIATSRWACPSPIGEEMYSARLRRDLPRTQRRGGGAGLTKSRSSRLTLTGSRTWGAWPEPSSSTSRPPVCSARAIPRVTGGCASSSPWMTSTGQRTRAASSAASSGFMTAAPSWVRDQRLGGRCPAPSRRASSIGLVECGSVNILREEELEEVLVVLEPVVLVVLGPALVGVEPSSGVHGPLGHAARRRPRQLRGDEHDPPRPARDGSRPSSSASVRAHRDSATRTARSVPVASITARASAANSARRYASGSVGRSERPLPRPSKVSTRQCRAR